MLLFVMCLFNSTNSLVAKSTYGTKMEKQQTNAGNHANEGKRIPLSLQAVFLTGNRGKEVNVPPPDASAMKVFHRTNVRGGSRWRPFRSWSSSAASSRNTIATLSSSAETKTKDAKKSEPVRKIRRSKVSD
jgi:hypothetical protein